MKLSNYLVTWVVTYSGDLQPTYIGLIIYLLSTMDIPVLDGFLPPGPTLAGMHSSWLAAGGMLPGGAAQWYLATPGKLKGAQWVNISLDGGFKYFFIFTPTWGNDPIWLIFFKWVETTNYKVGSLPVITGL